MEVEIKTFGPEARSVKIENRKRVDNWTEVPASLIELANQLIQAFHLPLKNARIGFLFRTEPTTSNGKRVWAKALKVTNHWKMYADLDFIIWIDEDMWVDLDEDRRKALIDHELCHCDFTTGEAKIRAHDFEEFHEIVKRHGAWNHELLHLQSIFPQSPQLPIPGFGDEPKGKVIALDPGKML